ncbi:PREDICTED: two pore potassium channel protein sup-9-like [Priapulus caudatus]|uniref:Two pore potassium channel protein sup-9-like n=1 Tax=Priapulus caudatus TaxID=37621 RepID=A0ABM1EN36_PRICU|nr:PREDICTED: two pore potassium channel protein sup-9-like [Priapulus caudatus]
MHEACVVLCAAYLLLLYSSVNSTVYSSITEKLQGGLIFRAIESPFEMEKKRELLRVRDELVDSLWELTLETNIFWPDNWTREAEANLQVFEKQLVKALRQGYDGLDPGEAEQQWSFSGALLFSITVITTIGYGNLAPRTYAGKLLTILYAVIGIPIMLLCLANIGDFLAHSFKYLYARLLMQYKKLKHGYLRKRHLRHRRKLRREQSDLKGHAKRHADVSIPLTRESHGVCANNLELVENGLHATVAPPPPVSSTAPSLHDDSTSNNGSGGDADSGIDTTRVTVPVTLCLGLLIAYIWLGAFIFSVWEKWKLLDGAYFCFVTLSTIGFGDFVPGASLLSQGADAQTKLATCALYLLFGLALISMCFNLVQEEVGRKFYMLGKKIGSLGDADDNTIHL